MMDGDVEGQWDEGNFNLQKSSKHQGSVGLKLTGGSGEEGEDGKRENL
jgi:hypothetical protein